MTASLDYSAISGSFSSKFLADHRSEGLRKYYRPNCFFSIGLLVLEFQVSDEPEHETLQRG